MTAGAQHANHFPALERSEWCGVVQAKAGEAVCGARHNSRIAPLGKGHHTAVTRVTAAHPPMCEWKTTDLIQAVLEPSNEKPPQNQPTWPTTPPSS